MSPTSDDSDMEENNAKTRSNANSAIPLHPGIRAKRHVAEATERATRAALADEDLLETAEGGLPSKARMIIDVPLSRIPGSRGEALHDKAVFEAECKNERNRAKRTHVLLRCWTKIYSRLSEACVDTCPFLNEEMHQLCDMSVRGYPKGTYDGPLAYRLYMSSLRQPDRTKEDRDFYESVLSLMKTNQLPDNCTGAGFLDKAMAFIVHVYKNVPRPFTPELAGEEIVGFMPFALSADGRRLLTEMRRTKILGDLRHVAHACEDVVETAHDTGLTIRPTPRPR